MNLAIKNKDIDIMIYKRIDYKMMQNIEIYNIYIL